MYAVYVIAKAINAHGVRSCGRENIKDTSAHCELPAVHHQVCARIGILHKAGGRPVQAHLPACRENQRFHILYAPHHRLDKRAHRHCYYFQRPEQ